MIHTHMHTHAHRPHPCAQMHKRTHAHTHGTQYMHTESERNRKMLIQFDCLLGHNSNQPKKLSTGMHAPDDGIGHDIITTTRQQPQMSMSTAPMQQVWPERSQNASDKQQTMEANLVNGLHIKSTGFHEVLHHGQVTLFGCPVQGCVAIIIAVKEVAPHLGGKVLSNRKMAAPSTQEKGIASSLH